MNARAYSEDQHVENPAIGLFAELGWQMVSALGESFWEGGMPGHETKGEVVQVDRLRAALCKFNPALPPAVDELARDRSVTGLAAANCTVYRLLKDGVTVSVPDHEHAGQRTLRVDTERITQFRSGNAGTAI
jgi:type I restriction enzyme, R subunit